MIRHLTEQDYETAQHIVDQPSRPALNMLLTNEHVFLAFAQVEDMFARCYAIELNPHTILQGLKNTST